MLKQLFEDARARVKARVSGHAPVSGNAAVNGEAKSSGNAAVKVHNVVTVGSINGGAAGVEKNRLGMTP